MTGAWLLERLARASLDGAVFVAAVALACRLAPRLRPRHRAMLWWLAAAKLLLALLPVAPLTLAVLPPSPLPAPEALAVTPGADDGVAVATASGGGAPSAGLATWGAAAWLAGVAALFAGSFPALRRARAWRHAGRPVSDPALLARVERAAREAGLRHPPELRLVPGIPGPLAVGVLRPAVLLPEDLPDRLSAHELAMALEHEIAHIARGDLWLGLVPAAARRVFFFHPGAWFVEREYAIAREAACDEAVVSRGGADPLAYGRLLLQLAAARPTATATFSPRSVLRRRIEMMESTVRRAPLSARAAWVFLAIAAVLFVPVRLVARDAVAPAAPPATPAPAAAPAEAPEAVEAAEPAEPPEPDVPPAPPSRMVAPRSGVPAPTPMALPAPPAPPAPPATNSTPAPAPVALPAPPAPPASSSRRCLDIDGSESSSYVIVRDGTRTMCGDESDVRAAENVRGGRSDLIWFEVDGTQWVVTDPKTVGAIASEARPSAELQHALQQAAARQADAALRMELLAAQDRKFAEARAQLAEARDASGGEKARQAADALAARVAALDRDVEAQKKTLAEFDAQAAAFDRSVAGFESSRARLSRLLEDALANGTARPVL